MPHVDIKFRPDALDFEQLQPLLTLVAATVGSAFDEDPEYVSVELIRQSGYSVNRKDIDLELDGTPTDQRIEALPRLAEALCEILDKHMKSLGMAGEVSAYCRLFGAADYSYKAVGK
jgi:phenylpyruvate tautomerase PptA (4-oxalocrotonate tautomerase family)